MPTAVAAGLYSSVGSCVTWLQHRIFHSVLHFSWGQPADDNASIPQTSNLVIAVWSSLY